MGLISRVSSRTNRKIKCRLRLTITVQTQNTLIVGERKQNTLEIKDNLYLIRHVNKIQMKSKEEKFTPENTHKRQMPGRNINVSPKLAREPLGKFLKLKRKKKKMA